MAESQRHRPSGNAFHTISTSSSRPTRKRFRPRYGFLRPIIPEVVEKFLECGITSASLTASRSGIATGKVSAQSRLQIRLEAQGNSVASIVFQDGFLIAKTSQFLHFRVDRALDASPDGAKDPLRGVVTHVPNAGIVNARVNINSEVVIACPRVNIDEAASVVDDSVGEGKLHHSLLKFNIRVVVKRPGRIAACRELREKSVAEDAPLPFPYLALGHDSPIKMLDHDQGVIINMGVKPLHTDRAVDTQAPKVGFDNEEPPVGIFAGNHFEAGVSSDDRVAQRLDRHALFQ